MPDPLTSSVDLSQVPSWARSDIEKQIKELQGKSGAGKPPVASDIAGALGAATAGPLVTMGASPIQEMTGQAQTPPKNQTGVGIYGNGVTTTAGKFLPWVSIAHMNPADQQAVLGAANLPPETLKAIQHVLGTMSPGDPYALEQALMPIVQKASATQQQSSAVSAATGQAAPGTAGATGVPMPAYTQQSLNDYTKNYMLPMMQFLDKQIQGDLNQWGGAIQSIGAMGGGAGGPIMKLLQGEQSALAPQYKLLADSLAKSMVSPQYLQAMNAEIAGSAAAGAKEQTQGSAILNLLQMALANPGVSSALTAAGGGTITPATVQNLLSGIGQTPAIQPALPGVTTPGG